MLSSRKPASRYETGLVLQTYGTSQLCRHIVRTYTYLIPA